MALIEIADPSDARLDVFRRVPDADLRAWPDAPHGLFIGESDKVINRALDAGVTCRALFMERKWVRKTQPIIDRLAASNADVDAFVVDHATFRAVTGYEVTRGALGALERPAERTVAAVTRGAHRIAVLEDITNYTNIGAAFRSAAALGVDAVLVTPSCHDPLFRRAARVSMGTVFQVPWARIGSVRDWAAEAPPCCTSSVFRRRRSPFPTIRCLSTTRALGRSTGLPWCSGPKGTAFPLPRSLPATGR